MIKIKELLQKENVRNILLLAIVSMLVCLPLLNSKTNISYDDGIQHIARLMGTYQSIKEGQIFPVIMSKFCNNFGYSWNLFYSPLTAYAPLLFKLLGASFIGCMKLFIFFIVFFSGMTMYFFTYEVTKKKKIALLAGIFYLFAPYRFTDMYLRNALAELASFAFLPMVFQGLYGVLKRKPKREYILILGSIGLILSHTVIAMYTAILCVIYLLIQIKEVRNKEVFKKLVFSLIFILVITSFFWLPLLEHKMATHYEVFQPGRMERTEVLIAFKLNFDELFFTSQESLHVYEIGILSVILLVTSPIVIQKLRKKWRNTDFYRFYLFALIVGVVCCIMTLKIFPFEHLPAILKMLQFSFRLLEFSSFFFAFVVAVNLKILVKKVNATDITLVIIILMFLSSLYSNHIPYTENLDESKIWPAVRVTSQTGRVHAGCASFEYLPSKAFENREWIETREDKIILLEGEAQLLEEKKENTNLTCRIVSAQEGSKLELPYIYYLGYEITLKQENEMIKLQPYETENGFVGITLPEIEEGTLQIHYTGTYLMKLSAILSGLGLILLLGKMIFHISIDKNKQKC